MNLRIPGPTPCPPEVLQALSRPMINHRGPEFAVLLDRCTEHLRPAFQTTSDIMILTSSGTGAMEAAITNTLSPGDDVLGISIGYFGDRFSDIAAVYGANVIRYTVPHGQAADPDRVRELLHEHPSIKAVLVTHNETSTGVTNDLKALAKVVNEAGPLLLVDSISSLSSLPIEMDEWGLDLVLSASQKGWMVPPGLAFVAISKRAWAAMETARMPRYYFDLRMAKDYAGKGQTPATPAISLFFGLDVAFEFLEKEGWPAIYARHRHIGEYTRSGLQALGLDLFADPKHASNTVTTVKLPSDVSEAGLLKTLREKYGIVVAGGQGSMAGTMLRIGHLGMVSEADITALLDAVRTELPARPAATAEAARS